MKRSTCTLISLLSLAVIYCAASVSYALDAPHNDVGPVVCDNCHYPSNAVPPMWASAPSPTGSTPLNELCVTCHYSLNGALSPKFADVKTHSSYMTNPTATGSNIYLMECRDCHNPHLQDQLRANPTLGDLTSGVTSSISASSLTDMGKTWAIDQFKDALLIPNTAYTANSYRIVGNTANTLTVAGTMKAPPFTGVGKPYSVKYGKMIKSAVVTASSGTRLVTFLSNSGPYSFATSSTVITGICQVCHTKTTSFTNTGILAGPGHVQNVAGTNCTGCHLHKEGFKGGGCNGCHGMSGGTGAPLVSSDLVTPATGHDEGKHVKHVVNLNQGCQVCHAGTTMPTLDSVITMSFSGMASGGSYRGTALNAPYTYSAGVTTGASQQCSNIACHSTVQSGANGTGAPTYATPQWTVTTPALNCGSCHVDMSGASATGSHPKHVTSSGISCASCHTGYTVSTTNASLHANNQIDVAPGSGTYSTDKHAPRGGYGTCSATYCHGTPASPLWGTAGTTCVSCHDATSTLPLRHGSHYNSTVAPTVLAGGTDKHTATAYVYSCLACHPSNQHANGPASAVAPLQDAAVTGTKVTAYVKGSASAVDAKGFNYTINGTCTTVCHTRDGVSLPTVTAQNWGSAATGSCGVCHNKAGDASPVWTAPHSKHINSYAANTNISCSSCHNGTAASNTALQATVAARNQHPNGNRDLAMNTFATGSTVVIAGAQGSQTCSNTYCHSNGTTAAGLHTAITWTGTTTCASCHAATPATGAHAAHLATTTGIRCNNCHNATASNNTTISNVANHVNKLVDISFNALSAGATATYNGIIAGGGADYQKPVGSAAGTCNSTLCHGGSSQNWTTTNVGISTCVKCHGVATATTAQYAGNIDLAAPGYVSVSAPVGTGVNVAGATGVYTSGVSNDPKVGAHDTHLRGLGGYKPGGIACTDCHAVTNIGDPGHMNGSTTFSWSSLATNSGALTPTYSAGGCSTNYCHGGAFGAGVIGTGSTPTWTDGAYLSNPASAMNSIDCNKCHLSPPTEALHPVVTFGSGACNSCHGHDGSGAAHIDGVLQQTGGSGCNSCHDYDVDAVTGDWGKNQKAVEGWGAHATHISHLKSVASVSVSLNPATDTFGGSAFNAVCGVCHTRNSANHSMSNAVNTRSINFGDGLSVYSFGTGTPLYNGVTGVSSATTPKTCSNISCHYQATPVWQGL
jgi:predicted CxxxxCH...CXXCH cytochrome family protein